MPASPEAIALLRADIARLERSGPQFAGHDCIAFGVPALDRALGGGLARGAVHGFSMAAAGDGAAACALALILCARTLRPDSTLVVIRDSLAGCEAGGLYGPGLPALGLDPGCLVLVETRSFADALVAAEEVLRSGAVPAVIVEGWRPGRALDLVAARRLVLGAEAGGSIAFLLRGDAREEAPLPFATRWRVGAAPAPASPGGGPGGPAFALSLLRNRLGPTGEWRLAFDERSRSFARLDSPALPGGIPLPAARKAGS